MQGGLLLSADAPHWWAHGTLDGIAMPVAFGHAITQARCMAAADTAAGRLLAPGGTEGLHPPKARAVAEAVARWAGREQGDG